jgi:hypothetical protein
MQRNKTQRRRTPHTPCNDMVGPFGGDSVVRSTESSLDALFAAEASNTFQQPWQKLDRGGRLDRLRKFVNEYTGEPLLTPAERASLLTAVLQAFELRQLNSKLAVDYDPATATITAIRGLRERTNGASGLRTFRIDATPPTRTTQRRTPAAKTSTTPPLKPTAPEQSNV